MPRGATELLRAFRAGQLGGLAGDSLHVGLWAVSVSVADLLTVVLITRTLGVTEYGRFALVIAFVFLVGQLFDVRMTTATTAFAARRIPSDHAAAADIFRFSYLVDAVTGVLGFCVVMALAPIVAPPLVGSGGVELTMLCATMLLVGTVDDTSITVMRLLDRFRLAAVCGAAAELLRVALVVAALTWSANLNVVFGALIAYTAVKGLINLGAARSAFKGASGGIRLLAPGLPPRQAQRTMLAMLVHTSLASYSRLAMTHLPTVIVGAISGATQVGIYRVGMAVASAVGRLADPAMSAIFPRVAKLWSAGRREEIRKLVLQATVFAAMVIGLAATITIVLREPIVEAITGDPYVAAIGAVLVLGSIGQAINGILFWNGQVLFGAGRARPVAVAQLVGAGAQVALLLWLVPLHDAKGAALAFLIAQIVINVGLTVAAVRLLWWEKLLPDGEVRLAKPDPIESVAPR